MNLPELSSLLSEKKLDVVENVVKDALLDAEANGELLLAAFRDWPGPRDRRGGSRISRRSPTRR